MKIKDIKRILFTHNKRLKSISQKQNVSLVYLWIDYAVSFLIYGVSCTEYVSYEFFNKKHNYKRNFITHRKSKKIEKWFNAEENKMVFNNKKIFNEKFSDFVKREWIYSKDKSNDEIVDFIKEKKEVIVKPLGLSSGKGIYKISSNDISTLNISDLKKQDVLIEELVVNHRDIKNIYPSSLNSVRIYTLINNEGTIEILQALLRLGNGNSIVDNFHNNGIVCLIDVETGIVKQPARDREMNEYLFHPKSNIQVVGFLIPKWKEVLKLVIKASKLYPTSRYIAWDIAILDDRLEMIEGNYQGDPTILQMFDKKGRYKEFKDKR